MCFSQNSCLIIATNSGNYYVHLTDKVLFRSQTDMTDITNNIENMGDIDQIAFMTNAHSDIKEVMKLKVILGKKKFNSINH